MSLTRSRACTPKLLGNLKSPLELPPPWQAAQFFCKISSARLVYAT